MRYTCLVAALLCIGCAGREPLRNRDMAPYTAVLVFECDPDAVAPFSPREIEDEIGLGLQEHAVFSHFVITTPEDMLSVAEMEDADLIVMVRIRELASWDAASVKVHPGLATVDGLLWFTTAIGGWWVPDREFATKTDIDLSWHRPQALRGEAHPASLDSTLRSEAFRPEQYVTSGAYRLSLWERAKIWRSPAPYLMNLFAPAALIPIHDDEEVSRSLTLAALEDIKRDIAQKLQGQALGAGGAPYSFRLESPTNGDRLEAPATNLRFRYLLEHGEEFGLARLRIELKRDGESGYRLHREYGDEEILAINERIEASGFLEETLGDLKSGLNLVRFSAQTNYPEQWITNTIALNVP